MMRFSLGMVLLVLALAAAFAFSSLNMYLLFEKTKTLQGRLDELGTQLNDLNQQLSQLRDAADALNARINVLNETSHLPIEAYDYIVFVQNGLVQAKNGVNGRVEYSAMDAAAVINEVFKEGRNIYVKPGEYQLLSDIVVQDKKNARLDGDDAKVLGNGNKIVIRGENYSTSQYNYLSGFNIVNATVRVENSFRTTVADIVFENCTTAVELVNSRTWSEGTRIEDCHFKRSVEGIVFRSPQGPNATGSYSSSEINRCFFNLDDNSVAIRVEEAAEFSDSQIQDVRVWIGEFGRKNQTGLELNGSMYKTLMSNVVFESFAPLPLENSGLFAIAIGKAAQESPIIGGGVNFLGNWTARVYNPYNKWIYGFGSAFKQENIPVPLGLSSQYGARAVINTYPATLSSFKARLTVDGRFKDNETVTVKVWLELLDNTETSPVEKVFNASASEWLTDDEMVRMLPAQNMVWAILAEAKTTASATEVNVTLDVYGTST
jgi:uncharacterized protein YoxC